MLELNIVHGLTHTVAADNLAKFSQVNTVIDAVLLGWILCVRLRFFKYLTLFMFRDAWERKREQ